ncbi:MAG: penicillin-binding protein 2 [Lachnospiraceae bacterium]|nr:penicillin-binding protein 2 [Lachnospiraceae bacterium]
MKKSKIPENMRESYLPTPMQVTGAFFIVLFAAMSIYLCRYAYNNRQEMMSNSYNSRQKILSEQTVRGSIISSDGEILAVTKSDESGGQKRLYPFGNVCSHVVGYASKGRSGVESLANYWLIRSDISLKEKAGFTDAGQKFPGNDVRITIDMGLQETAYKALAAYRGAVVVTDVQTGAILAMVSKPDFDPNEIDSIWKDLVEDKDDSRLLNRAANGLYPPGSTLKIVTALEYIREHPGDYGQYSFNCTGSFRSGDEVIHCFHGTSHGHLDFYTSFQKSCNSSFANIGLGLDRKSYEKTLSDLMFNVDPGLPFKTAKSQASMDAGTSDGDLMQLAIGQGATVMTPIHLNMITGAVASGGMMKKPYLIGSVTDANGKVLEEGGPVGEPVRVMSEDEAAVLTEMMRLVVNGGTGRILSGTEYDAAGKTGSAEYDSGHKEESHAWFTGFAPAGDPQIAVTVVIEEAGSGGEYAVPVAKRVFDKYFE